jgi:hypothetical protein
VSTLPEALRGGREKGGGAVVIKVVIKQSDIAPHGEAQDAGNPSGLTRSLMSAAVLTSTEGAIAELALIFLLRRRCGLFWLANCSLRRGLWEPCQQMVRERVNHDNSSQYGIDGAEGCCVGRSARSHRFWRRFSDGEDSI